MTKDQEIEMLKEQLKKFESGFDEVCEGLDRQTKRLIEVERELRMVESQRDHNLFSARLMTDAAEEAQDILYKAINLLADVVATRELEKEAMALHEKIEDFLTLDYCK